MASFDLLHPLLRHHIANTMGWQALRPLQEASIPPILAARHALLLAPTAQGKTEAAILPALSRVLEAGWDALSILYVCPLRALINNLEERLSGYFGMVGLDAAAWHGDVVGGAREKLKRRPPQCLITTPESLEVMLISSRPEARAMLRETRIVIVDELHAFARDDRGTHLLAVLERIVHLAGRELQRIGLSATVGNPEELLGWFAGHCEGIGEVVSAEGGSAETDVTLDFVGNLDNAAEVISRLHRGEKRLVFCDSRGRAEQLAARLRDRSIETHVSHSSLSRDERKRAEEAFARARDCAIVATSTLELGIDIGDLDRVIQIDAPSTVASFLQRLGRTGRRPDTRRNCLFLATRPETLLSSAALLSLWRRGFVEPVTAPPLPYHLFAQQMLALALQQGGIGRNDWQNWIGRLPAFRNMPEGDIDGILQHLTDSGMLYSDGSFMSVGQQGEERYGRRHFLELVSVFTSPPVFKVLHGDAEIGTIDELMLIALRQPDAPPLALAGRNWFVMHVDWSRREVFVQPADQIGQARWFGPMAGLPFHLCREIRAVLLADDQPSYLSTRAKDQLAAARTDFAFLREPARQVFPSPETGGPGWYTFAGSILNQGLAAALSTTLRQSVRADDYAVHAPRPVAQTDFVNAIRALANQDLSQIVTVPQSLAQGLKFTECLPANLTENTLRNRCFPPQQFASLFSRR